jgi:hypothetical protein
MIGSVTRCSIWYSGLFWSIGNQLSRALAMIAHVRIWMKVKVSCAT